MAQPVQRQRAVHVGYANSRPIYAGVCAGTLNGSGTSACIGGGPASVTATRRPAILLGYANSKPVYGGAEACTIHSGIRLPAVHEGYANGRPVYASIVCQVPGSASASGSTSGSAGSVPGSAGSIQGSGSVPGSTPGSSAGSASGSVSGSGSASGSGSKAGSVSASVSASGSVSGSSAGSVSASVSASGSVSGSGSASGSGSKAGSGSGSASGSGSGSGISTCSTACCSGQPKCVNINFTFSGGCTPGCNDFNVLATDTFCTGNWSLNKNAGCGVIDWTITCMAGSYSVLVSVGSACGFSQTGYSAICTANPNDFTVVISGTVSGCCSGGVTITITPAACS